MISGAISFNSGILLFADTEPIDPRGAPRESRRVFLRVYGSSPGFAHSIFVVSESIDWGRAPIERCERALDGVPPAECTIDRMRETIERSLRETYQDQGNGHPFEPEAPLFVVLYSARQQRYALFRTVSTTLREVVGYDCQGTAAYLGHYLIRNRYEAARSMDELNLATVFSIAADTLRGMRQGHDGCGKSCEIVVLYADGHVSSVERILHDSRKERAVTLTCLART